MFGRFPYLLVCLVSILLSFCSFYLCVFHLTEHEETLSYKFQVENVTAKDKLSDPLESNSKEDSVIDVANTNADDSEETKEEIIDIDIEEDNKDPLEKREIDLSELRRPEESNLDKPLVHFNLDVESKKLVHFNLDEESKFSPESPESQKFEIFSIKTLGPIFLYCCISYTSMNYMTALPLYFSAPSTQGGLSLNSRDTSISFSVIAGAKVFVQFFLVDWIFSFIGSTRAAYCTGMIAYLPVHILIPFLVYMAPVVQTVMILILMSCLGTIEAISYLGVMLMITESQVPQNLGVAHGLASTLSALTRTVAPAVGGSVWEWGVSVHAPWVVFLVGGIVAMLGVLSMI